MAVNKLVWSVISILPLTCFSSSVYVSFLGQIHIENMIINLEEFIYNVASVAYIKFSGPR